MIPSIGQQGLGNGWSCGRRDHYGKVSKRTPTSHPEGGNDMGRRGKDEKWRGRRFCEDR